MIEQRFRENYDGEFVVIDTVWRGGRKLQSREYIKNPIVNQHISGRAVIIGNDETARQDVIKVLENHRGGLLGSKRLQTYGCEGIWRKIRLDFCVENDANALSEMIEKRYTNDSVVYSTVRNCLKFPGNFYIVPYGVRLQPCAAAAYLAAFDGHKEIFLVGVDGINPETVYDTQSIRDMDEVFKTYDLVDFYLITDAADPPDVWRDHKNVHLKTYAWFINYCDV